MKEYTEDELKYKAEAYCSTTEHCPAEVMAKLIQWGADGEMSERILAHLQKEHYVDSVRFVELSCATNTVSRVGEE